MLFIAVEFVFGPIGCLHTTMLFTKKYLTIYAAEF